MALSSDPNDKGDDAQEQTDGLLTFVGQYKQPRRKQREKKKACEVVTNVRVVATANRMTR